MTPELQNHKFHLRWTGHLHADSPDKNMILSGCLEFAKKHARNTIAVFMK